MLEFFSTLFIIGSTLIILGLVLDIRIKHKKRVLQERLSKYL